MLVFVGEIVSLVFAPFFKYHGKRHATLVLVSSLQSPARFGEIYKVQLIRTDGSGSQPMPCTTALADKQFVKQALENKFPNGYDLVSSEDMTYVTTDHDRGKNFDEVNNAFHRLPSKYLSVLNILWE